MLNDLPGKVAVVTGAGSGIGRSLVAALAAEGMRVVAADIEADALAGTAELVGADGIVTRVTDVRDAAEVDALADLAYETFGAVHLLCNNAGVFQGGVLWERTDAELDWVLGVNLWGILNGIRSFIPRMLAAGDAGPRREHGVDGGSDLAAVLRAVRGVQVRRRRRQRVARA